jgi:hypothetical protein
MHLRSKIAEGYTGYAVTCQINRLLDGRVRKCLQTGVARIKTYQERYGLEIPGVYARPSTLALSTNLDR